MKLHTQLLKDRILTLCSISGIPYDIINSALVIPGWDITTLLYSSSPKLCSCTFGEGHISNLVLNIGHLEGQYSSCPKIDSYTFAEGENSNSVLNIGFSVGNKCSVGNPRIG